jgi:uncharacterized membrane protein
MNIPEQEPGGKTFSRPSTSFIPGDMKIVLLWTVLCILSIIIPVVNQSFLRFILALPMILFIPGYVLIAALFPTSVDIDKIERLVLSIGASIVMTPLIGLFLNFTSWGIRLDSVLVSLTVFIVSMVFIAVYRRSSVSPQSRYTIPVPEILCRISKDCTSSNQSPGNRIIFGICVFAILMVIASTVLAISLPTAGDKFTEFFILGENRTADAYPEMISPGILQAMYVGIGNHEYRTINYTVEVYLVPINKTASMLSSGFTPLKSYSVILDHNQTSVLPLEFSAPAAGFYRMEFLLFNDTVPGPEVSGQARINASYRNLHLQINATMPVLLSNNTLSLTS